MSKDDTCAKDDQARTEETGGIAEGGDNHTRSERSGGMADSMMLPGSPMAVPRVSSKLAFAIKAELAAKVNDTPKPRARLINPNEYGPPALPMANMVAAMASM